MRESQYHINPVHQINQGSDNYVRDAQGNVMANYNFKLPGGIATYMLKERNLYGSSRLGMNKDSLEMKGTGALNSTPTISAAVQDL